MDWEIEVIYQEYGSVSMMRSYLISSSWFKRVGNGRHNVRLPDIYLNLLPWEQYTGLILGAWYYSNETWPTRSWTRPTWLCHLAGKLYSHQRPDSAQSWTILNCYARFKNIQHWIGGWYYQIYGLCPNRLCWGTPWPLGWRRASCLSLGLVPGKA